MGNQNLSKGQFNSVHGHARDAIWATKRLFRDFEGKLSIRLWDGSVIDAGKGKTTTVTIAFHCPATFSRLVLGRDPLYLAECYFKGLVDVEGDIYEALDIRHYLSSICLSIREKLYLTAKLLPLQARHKLSGRDVGTSRLKVLRKYSRLTSSKALNKAAIAYHYDVSNEFYRLWLDKQMVYSCAYFEDMADSLERAQCNKLDHICRKLRLRRDEKLLDIGCGWGALMFWAAEHYGVNCHGITLGQEQYEYVKKQIVIKKLQQRVSVELLDYRELSGTNIYDKVVSVGMFEHVGLKNMERYFSIAYRQLKPGGLFLNHGIAIDTQGWRKSVGTEFINRYVFPDGQLDTVSNIQKIMEDVGFEIHDVENLRSHYALTLREWVKRLQSRHEEALHFVSEATYRVWKLYMAACAEQFEEGGIAVFQVLISKREPYANPVPLTRHDLYTTTSRPS